MENTTELKPEGFDLRTEIRDPKNERIVKTQYYTYHVVGGKQILERNGKFYNADGSVVNDEENWFLDMKKSESGLVESKKISIKK